MQKTQQRGDTSRRESQINAHGFVEVEEQAKRAQEEIQVIC